MIFLHSRRIQIFCLALLIAAALAMFFLSTSIKTEIRTSMMPNIIKQSDSSNSKNTNDSQPKDKTPALLFDQSQDKTTNTQSTNTQSSVVTSKQSSAATQEDVNQLTKIRIFKHSKRPRTLIATLDFTPSSNNPFVLKKIRHYSFVNSYTYVVEFGAPWSNNLPSIDIESLPDAVKDAKIAVGDANQLRLILQTTSKQAIKDPLLQITSKEQQIKVSLTFPASSKRR